MPVTVPVNEDFHLKWPKNLKYTEEKTNKTTAVRIRKDNNKDTVWSGHYN